MWNNKCLKNTHWYISNSRRHSCLSSPGETLLVCFFIFFQKRSRRHLSIQATKFCRLLSSLTSTGTKNVNNLMFLIWTSAAAPQRKRQQSARQCMSKVFVEGKLRGHSKLTDRLMCNTYPPQSYTSPSRRRRGCCTERRRLLHLRRWWKRF